MKSYFCLEMYEIKYLHVLSNISNNYLTYIFILFDKRNNFLLRNPRICHHLSGMIKIV